MNITCAAYDTLPQLTYDNVAPQALQQVVIAFKPGTSSQVLDSFSDALQCRGSTVDPPNYNTLTLTGFVSLMLATGVQMSRTVAAVEVDGQVTTLRQGATTTTSSSSSNGVKPTTSTKSQSLSTSSPTLNSDFGLDPPSSSSSNAEPSSSGAKSPLLAKTTTMAFLLMTVAYIVIFAM
ncbi:hypothetical protein IWW38_004807 [Coemansia aciculifera]|uniref:Uncharacterized protein n=1 Tax=Coemansia aciculifera TaxID=417176 RepID=A0ACC1LXC4_9FUNG|nr:hypothetical protein IWW38_004807 [Coemansia aciculifera]